LRAPIGKRKSWANSSPVDPVCIIINISGKNLASPSPQGLGWAGSIVSFLPSDAGWKIPFVLHFPDWIPISLARFFFLSFSLESKTIRDNGNGTCYQRGGSAHTIFLRVSPITTTLTFLHLIVFNFFPFCLSDIKKRREKNKFLLGA
jgi:hypothetical protein